MLPDGDPHPARLMPADEFAASPHQDIGRTMAPLDKPALYVLDLGPCHIARLAERCARAAVGQAFLRIEPLMPHVRIALYEIEQPLQVFDFW